MKQYSVMVFPKLPLSNQLNFYQANRFGCRQVRKDRYNRFRVKPFIMFEELTISEKKRKTKSPGVRKNVSGYSSLGTGY